jgi:hypothetical protein
VECLVKDHPRCQGQAEEEMDIRDGEAQPVHSAVCTSSWLDGERSYWDEGAQGLG